MTYVALLAVGAAADLLWTGGGVTLDANYSYSTAALGGAPGLTGGGFGITCATTLKPTGHSLGREDGPRATASSVTVHLVAVGGSCSGVKVDATFAAFPGSGESPGLSPPPPRFLSLCRQGQARLSKRLACD